MVNNMFITITGMNYYLGMDVFRINQIVTLEKDEDNSEDSEAICVRIEGGAKVGYVANSLYTKVKGTYSAGYVHRDVKENTKAIVRFITRDSVIAELIDQTQTTDVISF